MLLDMDSKPNETIFYIAMQLNDVLKRVNAVKITELNSIFNSIDSKQPAFKFYLALNFLFILDKVKMIENEVHYVPN